MENAQAISTTEAPKAIGPYSQGISAGQFLFVSGQLPINPYDGKMIAISPRERNKCFETFRRL